MRVVREVRVVRMVRMVRVVRMVRMVRVVRGHEHRACNQTVLKTVALFWGLLTVLVCMWWVHVPSAFDSD